MFHALADPIVVEEDEDHQSDPAGEPQGKKPKTLPAPKPKRPAPAAIDMPIISLVQDPGSAMNFFAGTQDGRIVSLQVRGEKHRVRCSVLHQMYVAAPATSKDRQVGIHVSAIKGYLFAVPAPCEFAASRARFQHLWPLRTLPAYHLTPPPAMHCLPSCGVVTVPQSPAPASVMHAYNISAISRQKPPDLLLYMPLSLKTDPRKGAIFDVVSDKAKVGVFGGWGRRWCSTRACAQDGLASAKGDPEQGADAVAGPRQAPGSSGGSGQEW